MASDTRTLHRHPGDAPSERTGPLPAGARPDAVPDRSGVARSAPPAAGSARATTQSESAHPDPRLIFAKTEAGTQAIRNRSQRVSLAARRLLMMLDGERALQQLPTVVRPGDISTLLKELETHGMITLAGVLADSASPIEIHPDIKLASIKRSLDGVFEHELGPQASVLEARVQDCVNLVVLRNVLREVINLVAARSNDAAADRIALIVKRHGPF